MSKPRRLFSEISSSKSYDPTLCRVITVTLLIRLFLLPFHLNRHGQYFLFSTFLASRVLPLTPPTYAMVLLLIPYYSTSYPFDYSTTSVTSISIDAHLP